MSNDYSNEPILWERYSQKHIRENHVLRYYCGYVEPVIDRLCEPPMFQFTGLLLTELPLGQLIIENPSFADIRDIFDHRIVLSMIDFGLYEDEPPENIQTIKTIRRTNDSLWKYALIHHTINWDVLNDSDKRYLLKWLNRLTIFEIIHPIRDNANQSAVNVLIERFIDSMERNFLRLPIIGLKMSIQDLPRERSPEDRHAMTVEPLYEGPANGLGCYFQTCEARLKDPANLDRFIDNMFRPTVESNADIIIVNIDRLSSRSKDSTIDRIVKRLLTFDRIQKSKIQPTILTESTARIHVIAPEVHVNAGVGRNITFNVIRRVFANNNLLWYGMDDDDKVDKNGLIKLRNHIRANRISVSKIVTVNDGLTQQWRDHMDRAYIHHYAQWCYAFSPVYYYYISYPCCPHEKEDLDVFNRLAQHQSAFVITTSREIRPYIYNGTNSHRTPHLELYNTKDVIRYLNAHNEAESIIRTAAAPSTSRDRERHNKKFYINSAPKYYEYTEQDNYDDRTLYGLSIHNDRNTQTDNQETLSLSEMIKRNPNEYVNENFDGDLKLIRYTLYSKRYNPMYGVSLQNGKSPYDISLDRLQPYGTVYSNYRTIADDIFATIGRRIDFNVYSKRSFIKESDVQKINASHLLNPPSKDMTIPIKTFGGQPNYLWRHLRTIGGWMIFIVFSMIIAFIVCILLSTSTSRVHNDHANGTDTSSP